jgi:micrococcal nuclease
MSDPETESTVFESDVTEITYSERVTIGDCVVGMLFTIVVILLLVATLGAAQPQELAGHVVKVYDGDTITIETNAGETERVRLVDIDAPELRQAHGVEARDALADLLELDGGAVIVRHTGRDKYGRLLGTVLVDDTDANAWQVNHGHAWAWREKGKPTSNILADQEVEAKAEKRGLWEDERPLAPWDYRARKRAQQPASRRAAKMPRARRPSTDRVH